MRTGTVLDLFLSKQKVLGFFLCVNLRRTVGTLPSVNLCRCSEFRAGGLQQPQDTGEKPLTQTWHSEIKRTCKHFRALFQAVLVRVRHTGGEKLAIIITRGKIWQHDTMISSGCWFWPFLMFGGDCFSWWYGISCGLHSWNLCTLINDIWCSDRTYGCFGKWRFIEIVLND